MIKDIIPIDVDLIKQLRRTKRYDEANKLLEGFRSNCKKQKLQDYKELTSILNKALKIKNPEQYRTAQKKYRNNLKKIDYIPKKRKIYQKKEDDAIEQLLYITNDNDLKEKITWIRSHFGLTIRQIVDRKLHIKRFGR